MGTLGNYDNKGLIPHSLEQIFEAKQTLQNQGWKYEMQVTLYCLCGDAFFLFDSSKNDDYGETGQYLFETSMVGSPFISRRKRENSFELLKLLKNSVEVLKILENKLESMKILENKLELLKLLENQPVDGLVPLSIKKFTFESVFERLLKSKANKF
nr:kinesin-like protein KIN-14N [Tanacetum cinerariifolium]